QGWGIFDGPSDSPSVSAIVSWRTNVVRLPLSETCWIGINDVTSAYAGANYQQAIADYVARLNRAGQVVILDLHWTAADTAKALAQAPMPNRDHTPEFWRQVATAYGHNNAVIFDLFNEPFPDSNADTPAAWRCWRGQAAPVAQRVPLVLGELGQNDRGRMFVDSLMDWMDARSGSYLAWTWDVWNSVWDLITSYDGTPTPYGATFQARFAS